MKPQQQSEYTEYCRVAITVTFIHRETIIADSKREIQNMPELVLLFYKFYILKFPRIFVFDNDQRLEKPTGFKVDKTKDGS